MSSFIYFIVAAALIGAALFGSDVVRTFVAKPDNVLLVQIFIAILGVVLGVVGLFNSRKKHKAAESGASNKLSIKGGVHISGQDHTTTIANRVEGAPKNE